VGLVGETFGDSAVRSMRQRMRDSPTGRQILADRPRVTVSPSQHTCAHSATLPLHYACDGGSAVGLQECVVFTQQA
jgi:hypothetical protein